MTSFRQNLAAASIWCILAATLVASEVISMPLPPGNPDSRFTSEEITNLAASMTSHLTMESDTQDEVAVPSEPSLFLEGVDALNRYAAREGRTRNHHLHGRRVSAAQFQAGVSWPMYGGWNGGGGWSGYGYGPWGWGGWGWGSPIIVNNYCPTNSGVYTTTRYGSCTGSFVGISVGF